ncbi:hypothetical protein ACE1AT_01840 [Pelatocladus sp. BLCC-F211]
MTESPVVGSSMRRSLLFPLRMRPAIASIPLHLKLLLLTGLKLKEG